MSRRVAQGTVLSGVMLIALSALGQDLPVRCAGLCRADRHGHFVALCDLMREESPTDGDDLLAQVDRSPLGALPPDYAPTDLVDLETMRPTRAHRCTPPARQCLRQAAARAYQRMARAMRDARHRPYVSSAFRAYPVQCATFLGWAERERGGFCAATTSSALPGHSQHQLGTTLDLFTYAWANEGDKFRPGFGCDPGGMWIAEHAHEFGFVLPYPLHVDYRQPDSPCAAVRGGEEAIDPRTGYRYEPWHLRFVGEENAARFMAAWRASERGTFRELTFGEWLSHERGVARRVPPVCDGCNCDRCATFASAESATQDAAPCAMPAMVLDPNGASQAELARPELLGVVLSRDGERVWVEARVRVSQNTWTQPPIVTERSGALYRRGQRDVLLPTGPRSWAPDQTAFRLVIGFDGRRDWPWSAALVDPDRDGVANGSRAPLVATPGEITVRVPMEGVRRGTRVRVGLARGRDAELGYRGRAP